MKKVGLFYFAFKRLFDICSSFFGILLSSPFLFIFSLIVKLTSKGPIFFRDQRIGQYGKKVAVLKFRTMFIDAETNIDKYLSPEQKQKWIVERKLDNDPRITKIGKFLRKTSIDELPQLFNIFIGNMSVVGPRPITERELNEHFSKEEQKLLLSAKPGLLGYWGVMARSNADFESGERQKLELEYFNKRGLWFDLTLIFKAIPAVLRRKGAK